MSSTSDIDDRPSANATGPLQASDYHEVVALLKSVSLNATDLDPMDMTTFLGISEGGSLAAVGCLQILDSDALLRSVATQFDRRGRGYAQQLIGELEAVASRNGVRRVYLLTETAATFFERLGYRSASRAAAPDSVAATEQFATLCPDSACFMLKELG